MLASKNLSKFELRSFIKRHLDEVRDVEIDGLDVPLVIRFPVEPCNLLAWLEQKAVTPNFYFQSRDQSWEIAGLGRYRAKTSPGISLTQWLELQAKHPSANDLRLFFARNFSSKETWSEFSILQNLLPVSHLERIGTDYFETHLIPASLCQTYESFQVIAESILDDDICGLKPIDLNLPKIEQRLDLPVRTDWIKIVNSALQAIESSKLEKVVLARQTDLSFSKNLSPTALMSSLQLVQQQVYHFMYSPKPNQAFLGASPERLFQIEGSQVRTEALAGTIGKNDAKGMEALFSDKNLREHSCVIEGIKTRLSKVADSVLADSQPQAIELADLLHLRTKLRGTLNTNSTVDLVLNALHPTAAVCGEPEELAAELIGNLEPFARGLYAGPIGVARGPEAECAVALRSCLAKEDGLSLFAGAGIVAGSNPENEWDELETKIATLSKLFA